ncbi:MAG: citrate lyase beta subunit [bacterium]|nr:citrate lyase beta subunit [bacterium]
MNRFDEKMITVLRDLKENYHVIGIKAEFEAEGTTMEEAMRLTNIAAMSGLDFAIKVGGCGAIKDLYDAKIAGANIIVAPMIESAYAIKKFVDATKTVFSANELKGLTLLVNIETQTAYEKLDEIVSCEDFQAIDGIVLGRTDMSESLSITKYEVNSAQIFEMAKTISKEMAKKEKLFIVGGQVDTLSIPFFKSMPYLTGFETRKIIFDAKSSLSSQKAEEGILKAIEFEMEWLKNKQEKFFPRKEDYQRIKTLEGRYKKILK